MTRTRTVLLFSALIFALYLGCILIGFAINNIGSIPTGASNSAEDHAATAWQPPSLSSIPNTPAGDSVRRGALLFDETPLYAANYTRSRLSCASCHAEGGIQPFASPIIGLPALFPMYNARAGRVISLQDRLEECFVRSENGRPLPYESAPMRDLIDYIAWVSTPQPNHQRFQGRGLIALPALKPNLAHGQDVYAAQCAGCHGDNGQGRAPLFPPVWGPDSFNDGAGMDRLPKLAAFVQHNMPQNRMGILSPQDAWDVSAFIHSQPRPAFNPAYKHF